MNENEIPHLRRAVELAEEGLSAGDDPFGAVLVSPDGSVHFEDHNHVGGGDATRHPEFEIARWSGTHLTPDERAAATVYTSTEHCPMCAAAHGWAGLGRIVYASSSAQLMEWYAEWGLPKPPVTNLPIQQIVPGVRVEGPHPELAQQVRELHRRLRAPTASE